MSDKIREAFDAWISSVDKRRDANGWEPLTARDVHMLREGYMEAALAQQPAPAAPVAQEPVAWMRCDEYPSVTVSGAVLEDWINQGAVIRPLYTAPPAAEQPTGTTSDQYRAELYDEVWEKARSMGYGNVTEALVALEQMKAVTEQPGTVKVPRETAIALLDDGPRHKTWLAQDELRALLDGGEE